MTETNLDLSEIKISLSFSNELRRGVLHFKYTEDSVWLYNLPFILHHTYLLLQANLKRTVSHRMLSDVTQYDM